MPVILHILQKVWLKFFPMKNTFFCLFEYFGVTILTVIIGVGLGQLLRKFLPYLYALLNGGRR